MELKPGYKQTEAGVIPEEWEVKPVAQIATVGRGRVISHKEISRARTPLYPVYSSQTSDDGVMGYLDTFEFEGDYITWTTDGANAGTVFARDGRFNCTNVCGTIKLESDNHRFVAKVLGGIAPRHVSRHLGNPKLMNDVVKRINVPLPPTRAEQDAIATALSDGDGLLEGLDQLIAKKRDLKHAAMQQLLTGQTRLPGFRDEWEVKRLDKLCAMKSGEGITAKNIDNDSEFPCYGGNGLRGFTTRFTHEGNFCLIGRVGALCGNLLQVTGQFFASEHAIVVTAFENVDVGWLTLALGTLRLNRRAESSAQPVLTVSKLRPLELVAPATKEEQTAIASVLTEMDAELAALEQRREKTRALKQAMMQELLTGRTRLV